jgi:hypothetical protein
MQYLSQTSPLSARHIAEVTLAEKSGVERARNRYLRGFMLFTAPISCHAKAAYVSQSLWRGLFITTFFANFGERRKAEVRRTHLAGASVNRVRKRCQKQNLPVLKGPSALASSIPQRWRPCSSLRPLPLRQGVGDATMCTGQNFLYRVRIWDLSPSHPSAARPRRRRRSGSYRRG